MKCVYRLIPTFLLAITLSGCASFYHPINPDKGFHWSGMQINDGVGFSYSFDQLAIHKNKKYEDNEAKSGFKLVTVKLINHTDSSYILDEDLVFYSQNKPLMMVDQQVLYKSIKQVEYLYLMYMAGMPLIFSPGNPEKHRDFSAGFAIGGAISLFNVGLALKANNDFRHELEKYDIKRAQLNPGDTLIGITGFMDIDYEPLTIRVEK